MEPGNGKHSQPHQGRAIGGVPIGCQTQEHPHIHPQCVQCLLLQATEMYLHSDRVLTANNRDSYLYFFLMQPGCVHHSRPPVHKAENKLGSGSTTRLACLSVGSLPKAHLPLARRRSLLRCQYRTAPSSQGSIAFVALPPSPLFLISRAAIGFPSALPQTERAENLGHSNLKTAIFNHQSLPRNPRRSWSIMDFT